MVSINLINRHDPRLESLRVVLHDTNTVVVVAVAPLHRLRKVPKQDTLQIIPVSISFSQPQDMLVSYSDVNQD